MNLKDTAELMISADYKDRMIAEYAQLELRLNGLDKMLKGYKAGTLPFTPTCSYETLNSQLTYMIGYRDVLKTRFDIEGIEIPTV